MDLKRHRQKRLSRRRELYRLCKAGEKGYQMSSAPASKTQGLTAWPLWYTTGW